MKSIDARLKFFWCGFDNDQHRHFHLKAWSTICSPKIHGGISLRTMVDMNQALLAKLGWQFITNKHLMWVKALEARYCRNPSFFNAPNPVGASWIWKSLLQVRDIISAGLCWGVKGGADINIWCDPWIPSAVNFAPQLKQGMVISRHINRVKDLIVVGDDAVQHWNEDLIRYIF